MAKQRDEPGKMQVPPPVGIANVAQLAAIAGVSASTVSRALAGNTAISTATRQRITALADAHGYRINQQARNLRLKRTEAIGVVLPLGHEIGQHLSDPFFIAMLGHLADALANRGHDLLLSRVIPTDDAWLARILASGRTDGTIVIGQSNQLETLERLALDAPVVVWGANRPGQRHVSVGSDNRAGGRLATEHLIAQGRRRLLFLGNTEAPELAERQQGFAGACAAASLAGDSLPVKLTADAAYVAIRDHLARHPAPDGIVAASDIIAMMAIRALTEIGLRVPQDVAVVGYDDVALAAHTAPPLTTIRQDIARGAAALVDLLFRKLAGEPVESLVMAPELVVRASTAAV